MSACVSRFEGLDPSRIDEQEAGLTRRRRISRLVPVLSVAIFVAICCSATAFAAVSASRPQLAGTWSGKYSGAYSGTFTLRWTQSGSRLSGSIALSNPRGKYGISGSVHGSAITFGAVGAGATYTGSVSGKSMSGRYKTAQGGGPWSAHKMT
jgi:hypothetical protein